MQPFPATARQRSGGFTVVEILVAMAISALLLAGVLTLFGNSKRSYETNDRLARIQENGRYALELIARDVRASGYVGCAKKSVVKPFVNIINNSNQLLQNFAFPVNGFEGGSSSWTPTLVSPLDAAGLPDKDGSGPDVAGPVPGTDVLVVRGPKQGIAPQRLQTKVTSMTAALGVYNVSAATIKSADFVVVASCDQATAFQVTGYTSSGSPSTPDTIAHAISGVTPANSTTSIGSLYPADKTEVYPVQAVIYFVDASTSGVGNSLWRRTSDDTNNTEELVEGVDSLQVKYGVDTNNDRYADTYVLASAVTNWDQVMSVRIALLVRSLDEYGADVDAASRTLLDSTIGAFNDRRQRMVFTTTATIRNKVFDVT